jgi:HAE1 family hydrophobic/amphiphilic exporter-1
MSGIIGRLFHEFAVVIMTAILVSGFVSLSLTPMLCSRFLKPPNEEHHNALYRASERVFNAWRDVYAWTLRRVVRHRFITLMGAVATLVATYFLYGFVPKGFIPSQDTNQIQSQTLFQQDASYDSMLKVQRQAVEVLAEDPNIEHFTTFTNGQRAFGQVNIRLKPRSERKLTPEQIIEELTQPDPLHAVHVSSVTPILLANGALLLASCQARQRASSSLNLSRAGRTT